MLIQHIVLKLNSLRLINPRSKFLLAGDKNDLNIEDILATDDKLKQLVDQPTRKRSILDIVVTDMGDLYQRVQIIPPIPVDVDGVGSVSDHKGVLVIPRGRSNSHARVKSVTRHIRSFNQQSKLAFGLDLAITNWNLVSDEHTTTDMVEELVKKNEVLLDQHFPKKEIKISDFDKPWITPELKSLKRQRQRLYRKQGKSVNYTTVKNNFDLLLKKEVDNYKNRLTKNIKNGNINSAYKALKKLDGNKTADAEFSFLSIMIYHR